MWMPSFFPSTCISSADREKSYTALAKSRKEIGKEFAEEVEKGKTFSASSFLKDSEVITLATNQPQYFFIKSLESEFLTKINRLVGLPTRGPNFFLRKKLKQHFELVLADDKYLHREGLLSLSLEELKMAVEDRGITSVGKDAETLRRDIQGWLNLSNNSEAYVPAPLLVMAMALRHNAVSNSSTNTE
ncbi:LETM1-like protein-domain-containing protein [Chytridium lagenaria]|nr:LETM1-like protein-domain-containing protein [Chytridium lagenaria]